MTARAGIDLVLLILGVLSAATLLAAEAWLPDMLSFFRPHLFYASLAVLLAALVARRPARMLLAGALVAFNAWPLMVRATPLPVTPPPAAQTIRVMSVNLFYGNARTDLLQPVVREVAPDVLVVQEGLFQWPAALATLEGLPYRSRIPDGPEGDVAILSRFPITWTPRRELALRKGDRRLRGRPLVRAQVDPGPHGRPFILYGIHAPTPRSAAEWDARATYFDAVADLVGSEPEGTPVMVVGDWNVPAWSPLLRRFLHATRLAPAEAMPWPAATRIFSPFDLTLPQWLGTPIDRLAVSSKIAVAAFHVGPPMGSDHRPVYADVVVR